VEGLLIGKPSGESQTSFKKWLNQRQSRLTKRSSGHGKPCHWAYSLCVYNNWRLAIMSNSLKAALLSGLVFPGIGQVVLKRYRRGVVLMLIVLACLFRSS